jgi:hypothetical protein
MSPEEHPPSMSDAEFQALLASVEELRALLAPLSEEDRRRVLELARRLAAGAEGRP